MHNQSADLSDSNNFVIPVHLGRGTHAEAHALRDAAALWLRDNLDGRFGLYSDGEVVFEHVADATMFKIVWGEAIAEVEAHNEELVADIKARVSTAWARP